jgi:hypothetical protein
MVKSRNSPRLNVARELRLAGQERPKRRVVDI